MGQSDVVEHQVVSRPAIPSDRPGMAAAMGRAFQDDPLFEWFIPNASRRVAKIGEWFDLIFRLLWPEEGAGAVYTTDDHAGAALWHAPGHWKVPASKVVRSLPTTVRILGPGAFARLVRALSAIEKVHPADEHWYLEWLATDPPMQRRGVGAALMTPVFERCDTEGIPAYLETQNLQNVAYYRHHGFEVRDELNLAKNGPHVWTMWRVPRS